MVELERAAEEVVERLNDSPSCDFYYVVGTDYYWWTDDRDRCFLLVEVDSAGGFLFFVLGDKGFLLLLWDD